jgi:hypothetical protein
MRRALILCTLLLLLILTGCAKKATAPQAIENYLKAKVSGNEDKLVSLSCKDWEAQAALDVVPFQSVEAKIDNLSCKKSGQDGSYTLVTCEGTLVIQYRGENPRSQSLSGTTSRALQEDGDWKMCGEQP